MDVWMNYFLLTLLGLCSVSDFRTNKIPNMLTMPFTLFAIVFHSFNSGLNGFLFSTVGMMTGIGLLLTFYLMGGLGAGDVKLMGAVGSFLGAKAAVGAIFFIALIGGLYSLALILIRREVFRGFFHEKLRVLSSMVMLRHYIPLQTETSGRKPRLKYGIAIALGTITYLLLKTLKIRFFLLDII
jgi:prepilin peptidase CpaA